MNRLLSQLSSHWLLVQSALVALLLTNLGNPTGAVAQNQSTGAVVLNQSTRYEPMRQTLFGWEEETRLMIMNRYHNYGGIFYDRGLFRFTTPPFTKEHDINLISYNFTPIEEHGWYYGDGNSFRTFMGSFNLGQFLHGAEIRNEIELTDRITFPLQMIRRYDMRADRVLMLLSFDYELTDDHRIGFSHTLNEQKPDLDATVYYQYGSMRDGGIQVELTALDWANNSAYNLGQKRGTEIPELRTYDVKPYMIGFRGNQPLPGHLRIEAAAGLQTPLIAIAESMPHQHPGDSFRDREVARYGAVMLEYARPRLTAGLTLRHTFARFSRNRAGDLPEEELLVPVSYGNRQIQNSLGAFLGLRQGSLYMQNWIWRNYNLDVQWDSHREEEMHGIEVYPFDFREFRWQMQFRAGYNPDQPGFTISLEFSSDYRHPTENYRIEDQLTGGFLESRGLPYREFYPTTLGLRNERLTLQFGYRFTDRSYLILGASMDLDGDKMGGYWDRIERDVHSWFDGGFGRFVLYY